jgi:D-alanyl-D-alanine carboxypeptidase
LVKAWILPLPNTVQEQVDQSLSHGFDGMIVYVDTDVDTDNHAPQFYTAGWHDKQLKIPAKPDALFKIASISKLYVAVSMAKLANSNRLSLDQTLDKYFPELVGKIEYADSITLRLMVQHRSGIPNFTNSADFWSDAPENKKSNLDYALAMPTSFAPDKGYEYSNTNYLLLREIIAKVTGHSHEQFIQENILTPLGLDNTFFSLNDVDDIDNVMSGYYVGVDEDFKTAEYGMLATAEDVGLFLRALNDGSVFTNAAEQAIYQDIYVYEHGGLLPGYQSLAEYHKDIDTVVVQFMNTTDFNGYEWNLSEISINRIVAIIENEKRKSM